MTDWWAQVTAVVPPADSRLVIGTGAVALLAIASPTAWNVLRHVVTVVHEGAHGAVALAVGRSLSGIRLHSDSSGLTVSRGRARGPGMVATLLAGYTGPGLLGLLAAWVLGTGHAVGMLWGLLVLLALLLLTIRNLYGLWVILASGVVLIGVTRWLPIIWQTGFAYAVAWFLLLAAPWSVLQMARARAGGHARSSDPDQLARLTVLSGGMWTVVMLLTDLACLVLGARLLLLR